ncbi:uncharacterized protein [Dysidea avara]|uniref:uncharacterized protein isoform X10 n=1 Tax=Dysidea avara TaxID=196820 RepID=UPI00331CF128
MAGCDDLVEVESQLKKELKLLTSKNRRRARHRRALRPSSSNQFIHHHYDGSGQQITKSIPRKRVRTSGQASQDVCYDAQESDYGVEGICDNNRDHCQDNELQAMVDELRESLNAIPCTAEPASVMKSWAERREQLEQSWESHRAKLFEEVVTSMALPPEAKCSMCGDTDTAIVRCHQCGYSNMTYLCPLCDCHVHNDHPLHDREYWNGHYFTFIPPTQYPCPDTGNLIDIERIIAPGGNPMCSNCKSTLQSKRFEGKRIVITLRGRYDLDDVVLYCNECKIEQHLEGYWIGCVDRHSQYLFDEDLFLFFDYLQKFSPGLSVLGFLHTLEEYSAERNRVARINPTAFSKSFQEWRYCRYELKKLKREAIFECPACSDHQHSVHIDGNKKLYRFSKVKRTQQESYYAGDFIVKDTGVDQHLETLGYGSGTEGDDGTCGTTRWKAAKAVSRTMPTLDETGIVTGGCRHVIAQKAVNMFRGEIYGYSHYLHEKVFAPRGVRWLWQDVICQYWNWARSKTALFPGSRAMDMKPALSVMHAKAHSWHCQILWGSRWQDGAGGGAGEDMEQFFSYISRWGSTSKNMLPKNISVSFSYILARVDHITEAAGFWNSRKIKALPFSLNRRLHKTRELLLEATLELHQLQPNFDVNLDDAVLDTFKRNLTAIAQAELSSFAPNAILSDVAKYFQMKEQATLASNLTGYLSAASEPLSIVLSCDSLYTEAVNFTKKCDGQVSSMQHLENRLGQHTSVDGEKDIVRYSLVKLQEEMEVISLSIKRRQEALQKATTSSKQRSNLRKAITTDKSKLRRAIQKYGSVQEYLQPSERIQICEDDIVTGEFPWSTLTGRYSMATKLQLEATEKYNLIRRLKEEELLLVKEMSSYISFYQRIISELKDAVRVEEATLTLTSITSLQQHQGINNSDTNATNMPTSPVSSAATLTSDNSSAATLTSTNSSATLTSDNSSATLTSTNSSATLTSDNSSAATLTSTNSSAATLTSANSSASMQASTASNDVSSVQSGRYTSNRNCPRFIRGKIALLKMQHDSTKVFLSFVKNLLEASESDEVDISSIDQVSESGSDENDDI